ncbi:MAG: sensor domain-containing diguanylate cyclase [Chloroflexota bacterium]|nr:sensor domain-containing diguanylate cyclase [Chloroflexota bacterium]
MEDPGDRLAQDLLDSIFRVATELVRGERASLMLRDDESSDFVISRAVGLAEDVRRQVRVHIGEGIAGKVAAEKRAVLAGAGVTVGSERTYKTGSFVSVPIVVNDVTRGVLNVADPVGDHDFGTDDLATLEMLAGHIAACLQQKDQEDALKLLAETDPLTWLFNRRHFDRRLAAEADRARRSEHLLALLMVDVDGFKRINDRYGHGIGDQVLRAVAGAIREAVRVYDVPTRYGGDEFGIILPEADTESAARVGRRILEKLATATLPPELASAGERVRLSIGVGTFPRPATEPAALIEIADSAMYDAKAAGGGIRVWEHSLAVGPRGALRSSHSPVEHVPYLADPSRLATAELQRAVPVDLLESCNAVVVGQEGQVLTVALPQPNASAVEAISEASGLAVYPVYSGAGDLEATRRRLLS